MIAMTKSDTPQPIAAVILAAGLGTRMKSDLPKILHPLAGRPMILDLLDIVGRLDPERVVVVTGPDTEQVAEAVAPHPTAVQAERLGTGDAVRAALPALDGFDGDVLILFGADTVSFETLERLIAARHRGDDPAVCVLAYRMDDPAAYGRVITGGADNVDAIVEAKDATEEQLGIDLCNSGVMAVDAKRLRGLIEGIGNDNARGEYYLTDIVGLARAGGHACALVEGPAAEWVGVDSRADLADAEAIVQDRLRRAAMEAGATFADPGSVTMSFDTRLGRDVTIGPHVVFGPGVMVEDRVEIKAFSHLEQTTIKAGASIGPFARLRGGAEIGEGARVGNFVEIKNTVFGDGAKVSHLSYVGDATVGTGANIGAGTITCNYDGFEKSRTKIGAGAFIGSNTALVAPVSIGDGAIVGAGSVITKDVAADALAVTRAPQKDIDGGAKAYRKRKSKES
jgi:bifunctional UDP-N-acetylglucosamine pyrophosphorylase/glucosamine-1-phosphate N-acetyltransferase